jgi:hypothetical protein
MSVYEDQWRLWKGKEMFENTDTFPLFVWSRVELRCVGGLRVIEDER